MPGTGGLPGLPAGERHQGAGHLRFREALHDFMVHDITWRALSERFAYWAPVLKWFSRLSKAGMAEAFSAMLSAVCLDMDERLQRLSAAGDPLERLCGATVICGRSLLRKGRVGADAACGDSVICPACSRDVGCCRP